MKANFMLFAALGLLASACGSKQAGEPYTLTAQTPGLADSTWVYLVNYDNGDKVDSARVASSAVNFAGNLEAPIMARLIADGGQRLGQFILEPGTLTYSPESGIAGGRLNGQMAANDSLFEARMAALTAGCPSDSIPEEVQEKIEDLYEHFQDSIYGANRDNILGAMVFMGKTYEMDLDDLQKAIKENPTLGSYQRIQKAVEAKQNAAKTGEGSQFADFTVNDAEGNPQRLSDFAGKGTPLLVDFWASWCGPCRRETKVIKDILNQYADKGLQVLGVAVWDEPANTQAAIDQLELPWPQIMNAQDIPTQIYGIEGIPTILLIDGQGKIVSRGKQGDELRQAVAELMDAPAAEAPAEAASK